jgi:hypothetical protein
VAASAPFLRDDDEPDLADAENPFAPAAREQEGPMGTETVDDDRTPDESRDDVSTDDATTPDDGTSMTPDTATSESSWEGSSATGAAAAAGTGAAAGWAARSDDDDDSADATPPTNASGPGEGTDEQRNSGVTEPDSHDDTSEQTTAATEETVSVPALEDRGDYLSDQGTPADDPGDHRGQPWATTTGTPPPAAETDPETGAEEGQATEGALGSRMDPTTETEIDPGQEERQEQPQRGGPRVSSFEEVVDGGFGIGSAAPLSDGVQPLGHDVKASRDGATFLLPGDEGYDDAQPDVWFYNEESARRAGFRRQGE